MLNLKIDSSRVTIVFLLLIVTTLFPFHIVLAKDTLSLGVFPRRNVQVTSRMFTPLADHLSEKLGISVKLEVSKDFESFWEGVTSNKYDLVHFNQYHYIRSAKESGYNVILKNEEFGEDRIASSLIVRKDSNINSITDLKGKKIVFGGGPSAMISYIMNTYLLRKAGLNKGDYLVDYAISPPNAVFASYYGHADASGASNVALSLPVISKQVDTKDLKYLVTGEKLAQLPWAVKANMSVDLSTKIQNTLSRLKTTDNGKTILTKAGLTSLNITSDTEYDDHRQIIKDILGEDYCIRNCGIASKSKHSSDKQPLTISVFPRREKRKTYKMFKPIADYLSTELNRKVILETHKTFKDLWRGIKDRRYDLVHVNQFQYVKSHKLYGYDVILKNEEHKIATITPSIFVREDSNITHLKDLKGKRIIFGGGKLAMVSYVGNLQLLQKAGLKASDYDWKFANTPPNGCRAMLLGQADACGAATILKNMPTFKNNADSSKLRVLAKNIPLANINWAVNNKLGNQVRSKIQTALLKLNDNKKGRKILKGAGMTGLIKASEQEYDIHRSIIYDVLKERY